VRFGPWYRLADAARHAPAGPGVFQVRLEDGLVDYPTGKSAMVHYAAADDLLAATTAFAAAHADRSWLCRHTIEMTAADQATAPAHCDRLVRDFTARFGVAPRFEP
jgi:hypothetical protein